MPTELIKHIIICWDMEHICIYKLGIQAKNLVMVHSCKVANCVYICIATRIMTIR